jgi:hypothetical protein
MTEDTPITQVTTGEPEKTAGYVKHKIKTNKKGGSVARTRIGPGQRLIKRAEKKLIELLKDIPDEYLDRALRRLGEQLNATKKMWDVNAKCLIDIPDEKIRQDAALAILAYKWGRPVERQISASGDFKDFPDLVNRLNSSAAFRESYASLEKPVEGKEVTSALPAHDDGSS